MELQDLAVIGLVGSGLGAAIGGPMVWTRRDLGADARVFGAALLLMAAIGVLISARLAGLVPDSAAVAHAINVLGLVAMPLAVVYVRQATGSAGWSPALGMPAAGYLAVVGGRAALGLDSQIPFAWLLPVVVGFTALGAAGLWRRSTRIADPLVRPEWVVGFLALVNAAQVARMDFGHVPAVRAVVPLVFGGGFVAMVVLVTHRHMAVVGDVGALVPEAEAEPVPATPYERSALHEAAALDVLARVELALTRDRLHARADLTLRELASAAGSTPHLVSEALNRFGGTTFRELVTRRRVEDVKAQLADPASDRYTIEGIGASAGFRSRSALYDAFRRYEGTTPTVVRSRLRGLVED